MGAITSRLRGETTDTINSVAMRGASTSIALLIGDGSAMQTSAAPTTDAQLANKKYVDDEIASIIFTEVDTLDDVATRGASTLVALTIGDGSRLQSSAAPSNDYDISNKKYVDDSLSTHNTTYTHSDIALNTTDRHVQGTDQELDNGGANQVSASEAKQGYTHSQVTTGNPHNLDAADVGADPSGSASSAVSAHEVTYNHTDIALNTTDRHNHSNKALLDSYDQTNLDITDAISKKHIQGTDSTLDAGGVNEVSAAQAKQGYDHSEIVIGNPHDLDALDVGADPVGTASSTMSTHESTYIHDDIADNTTHRTTVTGNPHNLDSADVGADPSGTAAGLMSTHESTYTHSDIAHTNRAILDASTASYTTAEETKLAGIETAAEVNVNADWDSVSGDSEILNKPTDVTDLSTHSVTELSDVTSAGSGAIITSSERTAITHTNRTDLDLVSGTNTGDEVQATETVAGIAEIATQTEANTVIDDSRIITPAKIKNLKDIRFTLAGIEVAFLKSKKNTYTTINRFQFRGSTIVGTPTNISIIVGLKNDDEYHDFRIYDITNGLVIAELLDYTNTAALDYELVNFGTISNIPSSSSIFELQGRKSATDGGEAYLSELTIDWL